jgi:hypothetical protein
MGYRRRGGHRCRRQRSARVLIRALPRQGVDPDAQMVVTALRSGGAIAAAVALVGALGDGYVVVGHV